MKSAPEQPTQKQEVSFNNKVILIMLKFTCNEHLYYKSFLPPAVALHNKIYVEYKNMNSFLVCIVISYYFSFDP